MMDKPPPRRAFAEGALRRFARGFGGDLLRWAALMFVVCYGFLVVVLPIASIVDSSIRIFLDDIQSHAISWGFYSPSPDITAIGALFNFLGLLVTFIGGILAGPIYLMHYALLIALTLSPSFIGARLLSRLFPLGRRFRMAVSALYAAGWTSYFTWGALTVTADLTPEFLATMAVFAAVFGVAQVWFEKRGPDRL